MRPLDILSLTLVLCATALLLALPATGAGPDSSGASRSTLYYPGAFAFSKSDGPRGFFEPQMLPEKPLPPALSAYQESDGEDAARSPEASARASEGERRQTQLDYRLSQQTFRL